MGDRGERLISPELQANRIRAFADARGWEVDMLAPELDVSGGKVERPILNSAIEGVREGRYAGVIVAQLDRLSRMDLADALRTIKRVEDAGGQVIAVAENFDATTPEGRMARNVLLSLADMQLGRYKAQFSIVKRRAVAQGIWPMSVVPLGYRKGADRKLVPDPKTRKLIVGAFELRAAGRPWSAVADLLGSGITSASKIISNRVYLGEVRLRVGGEEIVNPSAHEPLIDRALFEAAQFDHPRPERRGNPPALLAGIVRCEGCGYVMSRSTDKSGFFYGCRPRKASGRCPAPAIVGCVGLDALVERTVLSHLTALEFSAIERTGAVDEAAAALAGAEVELGAFQEVVSVSDVGAENFAAGMRKRVDDVEAARRTLAEARLRAAPLPTGGKLVDLWPDLSVEEKRHVLRGSLAGVVVSKGVRDLGNRVRVFAAGSTLAFPLSDGHVEGEVRVTAAENVE